MTRDTIGAVHKRGIQRRAQSWETVGGSEGERERERDTQTETEKDTERERGRERERRKNAREERERESQEREEREEGEDRVSRTKWWCRLQHVSFNMVWFVQKSKT